MVPTNSDIFALSQSSQNIQVTDLYLEARYMAKYLEQHDANAKVHLKAKEFNRNMELEFENLYNTKITGSRIETEKLQMKRKDYHDPKAYCLSITQGITIIFGYETDKTNNEHVRIPTLPLQERLAIKITRKKKQNKNNDSNMNVLSSEDIDPNKERIELQFEPLCQFDDDEIDIIKDIQLSKLSVDMTTAYGIRAPELNSFITNQVDYIRWFKRTEYVKDLNDYLHGDIKKCAWIDGTKYLIKVRPIAIYNILCLPDNSFVDLDLKKLFQFLYDHCISDIVLNHEKFPPISAVEYNLPDFIEGNYSYDFYKDRFIYRTYTHHRLPDPMFNHVKPTNVHCFLVYLLLSMGEFSNEASLYKNAASMKECFVRAKLLRQYTNANPINEEDIYGIVRKYILQHILYVPDGTKSFGKYIVSSFQTLMSCFVYNITPLNETPPYLNSQLVVKASDDLKKLLFKRKKTIVDILHSNLSNKLENIPPIESFLEASIANPMQWIPSLTQSDGQSYESIKEQKFAFTICMKSIHQYLDYSSTTVPKSVILCGTPGSGKTHLLRVLSLYCISKGLTTFITAAQSARAIVLGGVHLHKTFLFPFHHLTKNVYRSASLTIVQLNKNPLLLAALKRLDILFVDEIGQHAAEVWSIIDIVLRRIRSSHLYLGGVKTFSTMDLFQLPSFDGKPFLLSPYILTSYKICKLVHSVRARHDVKLQRLNELTRKMEYTNEELDEFESIIQNECQHVDSWNSEKITPFMIRIFGKKSAVKNAEKEYINEVKSRFTNSYVTRKCEDLETTQSEHGNWSEATSRTSELLSREIKELEELILYPKAPIEFTYNRPGYWSQSQLGIVMNVPSQDDLDNWRSIAVYVSLLELLIHQVLK